MVEGVLKPFKTLKEKFGFGHSGEEVYIHTQRLVCPGCGKMIWLRWESTAVRALIKIHGGVSCPHCEKGSVVF